jgi:hypothetical protein
MLRMFVAVVCAMSSISAVAAALKIDLPPETAAFRPGPHLELVKARCLICHSADYVSTQPPNLPRATWNAEVAKMKKVYGAPFADEDAEPLVEYLVKTYGNERTD